MTRDLRERTHFKGRIEREFMDLVIRHEGDIKKDIPMT